eukprot:gene16836-23116_t
MLLSPTGYEIWGGGGDRYFIWSGPFICARSLRSQGQGMWRGYVRRRGISVFSVAASSVFSIPGWRHFTAWIGGMEATASNFKKLLRTGSVAVLIGGIAEMFLVSTKKETLVLRSRKGFVRIAVEVGCSGGIIPVYHFGNTQLMDWAPRSAQAISRKMRAAFGLMWGRYGLPIPRELPLYMVCGKAITVKHVLPSDVAAFDAEVDRVAVSKPYQVPQPQMSPLPPCPRVPGLSLATCTVLLVAICACMPIITLASDVSAGSRVGNKHLLGVCDKCNVAVCAGGCKCDSNCNCISGQGANVCDKCNLAQSNQGCKCDNNCGCLAGTCGSGSTAVSCAVSGWGTCSKTCGGGTQTRTITTQPANGGAACPALSQACNTQGCTATAIGFYFLTWAPAAAAPANTNIGIAFSGWTDTAKALADSQPLLNRLPGTKYISLGGGNAAGRFSAAALAKIIAAINTNQFSAYAGIVFDIEEGDSGLTTAFANAFAATKAKGLKVLVTVSHSAPYGITDNAVLMRSFFPNTNIDIISPQMYTFGTETSNDYTTVGGVMWEEYAKSKAAVVPSIVRASMYGDIQTVFSSKGVAVQGFIQFAQN